MNEGRISLQQATAIVTGLRKLPSHLTRADLATCQDTILDYVDTLGPTQLRVLATRLVHLVDPEVAEEEEKKRLEAEERAAMRNRYLRIVPDHHGSHRIDGKLPDALAITIKTQLDAFEPSQSSYSDTGDPPTPEMRRADALMRMVDAAASTTTAAGTGGRARVQVILDYDTLITGLGRVELPGMTDVDTLRGCQMVCVRGQDDLKEIDCDHDHQRRQAGQ